MKPNDDFADKRVALRQTRLARRRALNGATAAQASAAIGRYLDAHLDSAHYPVIGAYWPIRGEPDLTEWLRVRIEAGSRVYLPEVLGSASPLQFRQWQADRPLIPGAYGIPVADGAALLGLPPCLLVPCLGFTSAGARLGYGGGYYDRSLAAAVPRPYTIGICYAADELSPGDGFAPAAHDQMLDAIVTEAGWRLAGPPMR